MLSQQQQIREQRLFIGEQSATLALERAELNAAAEDRKWAQARQVIMNHGQSTTRLEAGVAVGYDHWNVTVENSSDTPIHQLEMRFGSAYVATVVYEAPLHPRLDEERRTHPLPLLGPNRSARFVSPRWSEATVDNNRPQLTFTDDNGRRWTLDSYGKLMEAPAAATA
ncbi:hypothetical protein ACN6K6_004719 [Streptomyces violaceoruber]|uniref:hypothetical protein n=1 Tax=Streptomyces violaceoruber TaxID=1935 RepID=UPI00403C55F9